MNNSGGYKKMDYSMMKEKVQHGNSMFPLRVYEVVSDTELSQLISCHWHDEIEIFLVTDGEAGFHINERSYHVKKGDILFIHPDFLHSASVVDKKPFHFMAFVFNTSLIDSFLNDSIQQNYLSPVYSNDITLKEYLSCDDEWANEVRNLLYKIHDLYMKHEICYELRIKACLFEIWSLLFSHAEVEERIGQKDNDYRISRMKSVITYIQDNYAGKITIDDLASITGLCKEQFCRTFKAMTRMSAIDYLNHYRIMQSAELLESSAKNIGEIAGMCGFNNISYFNKIFLKYMHVTPTSYRENNDK